MARKGKSFGPPSSNKKVEVKIDSKSINDIKKLGEVYDETAKKVSSLSDAIEDVSGKLNKVSDAVKKENFKTLTSEIRRVKEEYEKLISEYGEIGKLPSSSPLNKVIISAKNAIRLSEKIPEKFPTTTNAEYENNLKAIYNELGLKVDSKGKLYSPSSELISGDNSLKNRIISIRESDKNALKEIEEVSLANYNSRKKYAKSIGISAELYDKWASEEDEANKQRAEWLIERRKSPGYSSSTDIEDIAGLSNRLSIAEGVAIIDNERLHYKGLDVKARHAAPDMKIGVKDFGLYNSVFAPALAEVLTHPDKVAKAFAGEYNYNELSKGLRDSLGVEANSKGQYLFSDVLNYVKSSDFLSPESFEAITSALKFNNEDKHLLSEFEQIFGKKYNEKKESDREKMDRLLEESEDGSWGNIAAANAYRTIFGSNQFQKIVEEKLKAAGMDFTNYKDMLGNAFNEVNLDIEPYEPAKKESNTRKAAQKVKAVVEKASEEISENVTKAITDEVVKPAIEKTAKKTRFTPQDLHKIHVENGWVKDDLVKETAQVSTSEDIISAGPIKEIAEAVKKSSRSLATINANRLKALGAEAKPVVGKEDLQPIDNATKEVVRKSVSAAAWGMRTDFGYMPHGSYIDRWMGKKRNKDAYVNFWAKAIDENYAWGMRTDYSYMPQEKYINQWMGNWYNKQDYVDFWRKAIDGGKFVQQGLNTASQADKEKIRRAIGDMSASVGDYFENLASNTRIIFDRLGRSVRTLASVMYSGIHLAQALENVMSINDNMTSLIYRLQRFDTRGSSRDEIFNNLYYGARESRADMESLGTLSQRILATGVVDSSGNALRLAELFSKATILGGSSGQESRTALVQLSQALASNQLGGDELRSLRENAIGLTDMLAKGLKKGYEQGIFTNPEFADAQIGTLKQLGKKSLLTAEVVTTAISLMEDEINKSFGEMPMLFSHTMNRLTNTFRRRLDEFNREGKGLGRITEMFAKLDDWLNSRKGKRVIDALMDTFDSFIDMLVGVGNVLSGIMDRFSGPLSLLAKAYINFIPISGLSKILLGTRIGNQDIAGLLGAGGLSKTFGRLARGSGLLAALGGLDVNGRFTAGTLLTPFLSLFRGLYDEEKHNKMSSVYTAYDNLRRDSDFLWSYGTAGSLMKNLFGEEASKKLLEGYDPRGKIRKGDLAARMEDQGLLDMKNIERLVGAGSDASKKSTTLLERLTGLSTLQKASLAALVVTTSAILIKMGIDAANEKHYEDWDSYNSTTSNFVHLTANDRNERYQAMKDDVYSHITKKTLFLDTYREGYNAENTHGYIYAQLSELNRDRWLEEIAENTKDTASNTAGTLEITDEFIKSMRDMQTRSFRGELLMGGNGGGGNWNVVIHNQSDLDNVAQQIANVFNSQLKGASEASLATRG